MYYTPSYPLSLFFTQYIDKKWFEGNLLCVLSNAIKFSQQLPEVPVDIKVTLITQNSDQLDCPTNNNINNTDTLPLQQTLLIEVTDSGEPLEPEKLDRFFLPVEAKDRSQVGGMGMGLFTLAKRIEALGGEYDVCTRIPDGRAYSGLTVSYEFPIVDCFIPRPARGGRSPESAASTTNATTGGESSVSSSLTISRNTFGLLTGPQPGSLLTSSLLSAATVANTTAQNNNALDKHVSTPSITTIQQQQQQHSNNNNTAATATSSNVINNASSKTLQSIQEMSSACDEDDNDDMSYSSPSKGESSPTAGGSSKGLGLGIISGLSHLPPAESYHTLPGVFEAEPHFRTQLLHNRITIASKNATDNLKSYSADSGSYSSKSIQTPSPALSIGQPEGSVFGGIDRGSSKSGKRPSGSSYNRRSASISEGITIGDRARRGTLESSREVPTCAIQNYISLDSGDGASSKGGPVFSSQTLWLNKDIVRVRTNNDRAGDRSVDASVDNCSFDTSAFELHTTGHLTLNSPTTIHTNIMSSSKVLGLGGSGRSSSPIHTTLNSPLHASRKDLGYRSLGSSAMGNNNNNNYNNFGTDNATSTTPSFIQPRPDALYTDRTLSSGQISPSARSFALADVVDSDKRRALALENLQKTSHKSIHEQPIDHYTLNPLSIPVSPMNERSSHPSLPSLPGTPASALFGYVETDSTDNSSRALRSTRTTSTRFIINSPSSRQDSLGQGIHNNSPVRQTTTNSSRARGLRLSVLVIDDSLPIVKMTQMSLEKAGHVVDSAKNGKLGLELMKASFYDLVLIDIQVYIYAYLLISMHINARTYVFVCIKYVFIS